MPPRLPKHGHVAMVTTFLAVVAIGLVFAQSVGHAGDPGLRGLYGSGGEGWFWYEDPDIVDPKPHLEPQTEAPEPPAAQPVDALETDAPRGPAPFTAAWLRENLDVYRDRALDDPTPENVQAYFLLQRLAMDKAETFAKVAQQVQLGDPILDETHRLPTATYGVHAQTREATEAVPEVLARIAEVAGLFFFYSASCSQCQTMAPVLERFAIRHGFQVLPVSLDGGALPGELYARYQDDNGLGARLGVIMTPALFLAVPPGEFIALSQGVVSASGLARRILLAAHSAGLVSDEDFQRTSPVRPTLMLADVTSDGELDGSDSEAATNHLRQRVREVLR